MNIQPYVNLNCFPYVNLSCLPSILRMCSQTGSYITEDLAILIYQPVGMHFLFVGLLMSGRGLLISLGEFLCLEGMY